VSVEDQKLLKSILNEQLQSHFQMEYKDHCMTKGETDAVFVDFLGGEDNVNYEEVVDFETLRTYLVDKLAEYNGKPKVTKMDIVLFRDAVIHISKIYRVLNLKRGHALLVGVGGSGRHSLTRLSAFIANMNADQLEIRRDFTLRDFRAKLKELYELSAFKGKWTLKTVFIFSDNDVVHESFLEDIQNTLNSGVVPNLFVTEELNRMREEGLIMKKYKEDGRTNEAPDAVNEWFFNRVKDNMHLSICMSPVGEAFKSYIRQYPALINNTTIDWFMPWPEEALIEVANKFLNQIDLPQEKVQPLANLCGYAHAVTQAKAELMEKELKRIFYVTPTNFIELLKGFDKLLTQKRKEVFTQINKLKNGLGRLEVAREDVKIMTQESEVSRTEVSKTQADVQQLVQEANKEREIAEAKSKFIQEESIKIEAEAQIANNLAAAADAELAKAMPNLIAANNAVKSLDKKFIAEMKALNKPPSGVDTVMDAVMVFLEKPTGWASVKKELQDTQFLSNIMDLDKERIQAKTLKKIETYTREAEFTPEYMTKKSAAAAALCTWVRAIEDYAKCLKIVNPKREKKAIAEQTVARLRENLAKYEEEFAVLQARLDQLDATINEKTRVMDELKNNLLALQSKIERGDKLVTSLQEEKANWIVRLASFEQSESCLIGDCVLAAAFMSYGGPFPSNYRNSLSEMWYDKIVDEMIAYTKGQGFSEFMASKALSRKWQQDGLPTDDFSTENGVFVTRGLRWALNIDPQIQANKWIKKMCDDLIVADVKDADYLKKMENAIQKGQTILLQDVGEYLDPTLDNVLNKSLIQHGKRWAVKFGANEIEYN
jgi:dynein heavy chain